MIGVSQRLDPEDPVKQAEKVKSTVTSTRNYWNVNTTKDDQHSFSEIQGMRDSDNASAEEVLLDPQVEKLACWGVVE